MLTSFAKERLTFSNLIANNCNLLLTLLGLCFKILELSKLYLMAITKPFLLGFLKEFKFEINLNIGRYTPLLLQRQLTLFSLG